MVKHEGCVRKVLEFAEGFVVDDGDQYNPISIRVREAIDLYGLKPLILLKLCLPVQYLQPIVKHPGLLYIALDPIRVREIGDKSVRQFQSLIENQLRLFPYAIILQHNCVR